MKIVLAIYLISWIILYSIAENKNPIINFKKSIEFRGLFKTFLWHLVIPLIYFNVLLQKITVYIENFIDNILS